MLSYILRRLLFIIPTMLGILLLNFIIIQFAPGGPIDQVIAELSGHGGNVTANFSGGASDFQMQSTSSESSYRGGHGLDPSFIKDLEAQFGFDKPLPLRFIHMVWDYIQLDFGNSYFKSQPVLTLIIDKLPVSLSLGIFATVISYLISIPLGIAKAVRDGSRFDVWSSSLIVIGYAIPNFLFAILLITLFAGGSFWQFFPLRGLVSDNFHDLSLWQQILDYLWHLILPVTSMLIGYFATTTLLVKNSFIDEISRQYVITATAKGLTQKQVLYKHVFRNAMLIVIAGFPSAFIGMFFAGNLLIETIFSLDGLGLLGYEAVMKHDYPIVFGSLYIFTLIGLLTNLLSDITYMFVDPRIDFEGRNN